MKILRCGRKTLALSLLAALALMQGCQRKSYAPQAERTSNYADFGARPAKQQGAMRTAGLVGGLPGGGGGGGGAAQEQPDRKVVRTASLDAVVEDVSKAATQIEGLAGKLGGYVEKTEISQTKGLPQRAEIILRVPASSLDEARAEIKRLARMVETDKTEARDVTKDFVDNEARLRNYQAEERQYLEIMRRATKVEDTLNTAAHLSEVRGKIEELQATLKYLSQQVEMATIAVNLRVESVRRSAQWQPWYQTKLAFADMTEGLVNFADSVVYFLLMLPVILLWAAFVILLVAVTVKILLWAKRKFAPGLFKTSPRRGAQS